ncbi:MAG: hypothetical protein SCM96_11115 [Acidobacteriota bacterium]|nr:hypothetical protein [Acidobacteriota bacterium]
MRKLADFGLGHFVGILLAAVVGFILMMSRFGVSPADTGLFLLGLFVGVYVPGTVLCALAKLETGRLERFTLALIFGMTASTFIYRIAGIVGAEWIFWIWLVLAGLVWIARIVAAPPSLSAFRFRITPVGLGCVVLAAGLTALLVTDNYRNAMTLPDGSQRLHMRYYDGFTRSALVRELSHSIPPQMPFAAGMPISYHYDMNLFVSAFYKHLALSVPDLIHRFTLTFFFAVFFLAFFIFARRWSGSGGIALLGLALVLFGSGGLGWALALNSGYGGLWGMPFFSFYYLDLAAINPLLPALAILFAGLFALLKYFETRSVSWVAAAAFLLAVVTGYKMPFALPVLGALAGTAVFYLAKRKDPLPLRAFLAVSAATTPFLATAYLFNIGGIPFTYRIVFSNWIIFSLLDIKSMSLAWAWSDFVKFTALNPKTVILALAAIVVFFLGAFGVSLASLPSLVARTLASRREDRMSAVIGFLVAASCVVFFFANPFLGERSRNWIFMDLFKLASLLVLLYAAVWLGRNFRKKPGWFAVSGALLFLLSVPNTAQFVHVKSKYPSTMIVEAPFLEAAAYLNEQSDPKDVVLHSVSVLFVCYFSDRRVVLDNSPHSYLDFHLLPEHQEARRADIARFFAAPSEAGDVLDKYGVGYVWVKRRVDTSIWSERLPESLAVWTRGSDPGAGKDVPSHTLDLAFSNFRYALYKVIRTV